ncbi:hypothetical protein [Enterobacter sp. UNJFSC 003]|uniref:hypothetical protein n=1 Tax=Enterobacter sp. UNJFSC 003 TaxID=3122077 RepID=UPI002EB28AB7|nr:hypothetical protein [Serratia liquefaciens]
MVKTIEIRYAEMNIAINTFSLLCLLKQQAPKTNVVSATIVCNNKIIIGIIISYSAKSLCKKIQPVTNQIAKFSIEITNRIELPESFFSITTPLKALSSWKKLKTGNDDIDLSSEQ